MSIFRAYHPLKPGPMKSHIQFLQIDLQFDAFRIAFFCFLSALVVTLILIPPIIQFVKRYRLYDIPDHRKEHSTPIPTMGGIAILGGMLTALMLWFPFAPNTTTIVFFLSIGILCAMGIMDDIRDLSAKYKLMIEFVLALMIAMSGIRIESFNGLFGIYELPISAQYTFTVIAIVGVTNAFNLIDGIDGLAGGLGFMSLSTLGIFLTTMGEIQIAMIAFAMAGALMGFLYFNFNPAKIFMGDTGSLLLGFVVSILCIKLMQTGIATGSKLLPHAPVFVFGVVLIPVFDTLRVFAQRLWNGHSPFYADRTHIHHLLTNGGFSHAFATRVICILHASILMQVYWMKNIRMELTLLFVLALMLIATVGLNQLGLLKKRGKVKKMYEEFELRA